MELDYRKRKQEEEKQREKDEQKLAEARTREENCRNSRSRLTALETARTQVRFNDKGEPYALDEAQAEQERENARQLVEQWCK